MIVYAESNFLLELTTLQAEEPECNGVVKLAENGRITLVLPAFSLAEPLQTIRRRHSDRIDLQIRLNNEIALLKRSASYEERLRQAAEAGSILEDSRREEQERLDEILERVTRIADLIPLESSVIRRARAIREDFGLSHADAVVLASILLHLESIRPAQSCFLQRDRKDFLTPDVVSSLKDLNCHLLVGFAAGIGYLQANLD